MGAGAVGTAVGGFLARDGHRVTLVGRDPHMAAIRKRGLRIEGIWGRHSIGGLRAFTGIGEVPRERFDLVLVTTKSYDTGDAAKQVLPLLSEDSLVISLQNGLGNVETISAVVGPHRAVGGRLIFGIEIPEPGVARITVYADKVMLGSPSHQVDLGAAGGHRRRVHPGRHSHGGHADDRPVHLGQGPLQLQPEPALGPAGGQLRGAPRTPGDEADHDGGDRGDLRRRRGERRAPGVALTAGVPGGPLRAAHSGYLRPSCLDAPGCQAGQEDRDRCLERGHRRARARGRRADAGEPDADGPDQGQGRDQKRACERGRPPVVVQTPQR